MSVLMQVLARDKVHHWTIRFSFSNLFDLERNMWAVIYLLFIGHVRHSFLEFFFFVLKFLVLFALKTVAPNVIFVSKLGFIGKVLIRCALKHPLLWFNLDSMLYLGMLNELENTMKPLIAILFKALVWFCLSVPPYVLLQITARGKSFRAEATLEWSTAGMNSLVDH